MVSQEHLKWRASPVLALLLGLWPLSSGAGTAAVQGLMQASPAQISSSWHSGAKLHHMTGKENGDITIDGDGIEFRSRNGRSMKWPFVEVQTFFLTPHSLAIETYQNRKKHMPGMQRYRFDMEQAVPPQIAAELAERVQRPSQNAVTDSGSQSTVIPVHHRTRMGGTNGTLRLGDGGIDYVTTVPGDSRSWRWSDLQTLSHPDPYHLLVFGYRDTYSFDLKEPLPQSVFDRMTDALDHQTADQPGQGPNIEAPKSSPILAIAKMRVGYE